MVRIGWIDTLKLFAIVLVVWGHMHAAMHIEYDEDMLSLVSLMIRMPLLMMISGFFSTSSHNRTFKEVLLRKGRQLLLPAFANGAILCLHDIQSGNVFSAWLLSYWFLKSAFCCAILYYVATADARLKKYLVPLTLLLSQSPFQPIYINTLYLWWMYPSFVFGAFVREHFDLFCRHRRTTIFAATTIFVVMFLIYGHRFADGGGWTDPYARSSFVLCFIFRIYKTVMGVCGALAIFMFAEYMSHILPDSAWGHRLSHWGKYTLGIYCLHLLVFKYCIDRFIYSETSIYPEIPIGPVVYYILLPVLTCAMTLVCLGLIKLIHYSKWASFVLLGEQLPSSKNVNK